MDLILGDLFPAAVYAIIFPIIFICGEIVRRKLPTRPELSRKVVHFGGGMAALSFPFVLRSPYTVLLLALLFAAIILLTKRMGLLKSVHGIDRQSSGAVYFPIAITLLFFLGHDRQVFYLISILTLTISDSLAALVGTQYGVITYEVEEGRKSLEGSLAFFFITFLCVHLPLLLLTDFGRMESVLLALVIAILVAGFEAISLKGSDNIFVPLGTFFILVKMTRYPLGDTVEQTGILFFIIFVSFALTFVQKVLKPSGLIGLMLVNYAAWSLCDFSWFLPLLMAQLLLYALVLRFRQEVPEDITGYQVKGLFYVVIVPVALIFFANASGEYQRLYLPYVAAIVSQITLIFVYFLSIRNGKSMHVLGLHVAALLRGTLCTAVATAIIALLPLFLYPAGPLWLVLGEVMLATIGAFGIFQLALTRLNDDGHEWVLRQRIRMAASAFAAGVVFLAQLI